MEENSMKPFFALSLASAALSVFTAIAAPECDESGLCKLPAVPADGKINILSPVGKSAIPKIKQAPL